MLIPMSLCQSATSETDVSNWDTAKVTTMYSLAYGSGFVGTISSWDTASVTNFAYTLAVYLSLDGQVQGFNTDISNWDTSSATSMRDTFYVSHLQQLFSACPRMRC